MSEAKLYFKSSQFYRAERGLEQKYPAGEKWDSRVQDRARAADMIGNQNLGG
jgi:hypothetical protein